MRAQLSILAASLLLAGSAVIAQQPAAAGRGAAPPAPPAPAPGSPATVKTNVELMEVLKKNISAATNGEMTDSPVSNTDQYRINVVHRVKAAGAIAHAGNTELHYIISGAATVVTGGTIVRPPAGSTTLASIQNGETRHVTKGDVIIVPEGSAHWYKDVEGEVTYLEVRWVAPKK